VMLPAFLPKVHHHVHFQPAFDGQDADSGNPHFRGRR
jgi:hypothetical protein